MTSVTNNQIKEILVAKKEISEHVWNVFHRYIDCNEITFSNPTLWGIEEDGIAFWGQDGAMEGWQSISLYIPIKYFTETSQAFAELFHEQQEIARNQEMEKQRSELAEYKRLKKKFGE